MVTAEKGGDGKRIFVRGFRPITDAATVYGSVSKRETAQATASYSDETLVNAIGMCPQRVSTRYARKKRGLVRASYRGRHSLPFSLRYVGDFYAPPFGLAPGESHVPQRNDRSAVIRLPREDLRSPEQLLQHYDAG